MDFFLQLVINGLVVGSIYALVAMGFVIIYKSTSVLNFAQGEFLLLGAYISLALLTRWHVPFWATVVLTLGFAVVLGLAIERLILRPMIGEPVVSVIMVTLGLSSILRAVVQGIWGTDTRPYPEIFPSAPVMIGPVPVSRAYAWSLGCVVVLLVAFSLFFKRSRFGIAMRATAFSQQVALSMGISVRHMFALAWAIAAVVSAIGGLLPGAVRTGVDQALGLIGLKGLPVGFLGGVDSGRGAKDVAPFVILVWTLTIKPYGLFGKVHVERV